MKLGQKAFIIAALLTLSACGQPGGDWASYTDVMRVRDMAFDADGNLWIVHGLYECRHRPSKEVTKWDVRRQKIAASYTSADGLPENGVWSIAAAPDGVMWFGSTDGVFYFDGKRWGAYTTADGLPEGDVVSITVAPDGEVWVGVRQVGVFRFDGETWTEYAAAEGPVSDTFQSFAIVPDGTVWAGYDDIVSRFDGTTWVTYILPYGIYQNDLHSINAIAVTSDGAAWFGAGCGNVFQFDDGAWFHHPRQGCSAVTSIAVAPDGALWFGTESGVLRFDGETWTTYTTCHGLTSNHLNAVAVAPDGALWFGTDAGFSRYQSSGRQSSDREQITTAPVPTLLRQTPVVPEDAHTRSKLGITHAVAFSPDGQSLALGLPIGVSLYRADLSERIWASEVEGSLTECVAFSPDGATLASGATRIFGAEGDDVILWDTATGKQIRTFEGHTEGVLSVAFSPDGKMLASGASDGTIMLWNAMTGEQVHVLKGHTHAVSGLAFLPDGAALVSGTHRDRTTILWDTATGEQVHALTCESFRVYSPDGTTMACNPGYDIVLWDTATREPVRTFEKGNLFSWASAAFSLDGALLAAGEYWDDTIILWDTTTGEQVRALKGYTTTVSSLAFSPDGTTLASAARDGTITLWDITR